MRYYKVKKEYDNKMILDKKGKYKGFYIANELYTENEIKKMNLNINYMDIIEVNKNNVYWCFGARFTD